MQKNIHPTYYPAAKAACVCGATYTVGSTKEELSVEICSACHPFYTGKENILDTAGRLDRLRSARLPLPPSKPKKPRSRAQCHLSTVLPELKKDHKDSYFAESYEKLLREEEIVREMMGGTRMLREMAIKELEILKRRSTGSRRRSRG